jgi:uncharacterized protein (TIGR02271 family)
MQTVIGAFDDNTAAQRAVERLVAAGIDRQDVHVEYENPPAARTQTARSESDDDQPGFFARLFGMDDPQVSSQADTYDEALRRGSAIVVVDAPTEEKADQACTLLHELGAVNVDERAQQWRSEGWKGGTQAAATPQDRGSLLQRNGPMDKLPEGQRDGVLDVVQEELQVGKRAYDRGGVRVIQRVSQKPVREMVHLREEKAVVQRTAVNREASADDLSNFREGTLEVRETVEEPVVAKKARVVEEVRVGKEVREREEAVEDTVRRKDVQVEQLSGQAGRTGGPRERAVAADDREAGRTPGNAERGVDPTTGKPRKDI